MKEAPENVCYSFLIIIIIIIFIIILFYLILFYLFIYLFIYFDCNVSSKNLLS